MTSSCVSVNMLRTDESARRVLCELNNEALDVLTVGVFDDAATGYRHVTLADRWYTSVHPP